MRKKASIYIITFLTIIVSFFLIMIIVHCIPYSFISKNVQESIRQIESEGLDGLLYFFYNRTSRLDNFTDLIMIKQNLDHSGSVFYVAMDNNQYSTYWHGYQSFLRPLLIFFSYGEIRYLSVIVFNSLFVFCIIRLYKKLGTKTAIMFLISLLSVNVTIIPLSLQFVSVFNISFIAIILLSFDRINKSTYVPLFFMGVGMLTNFIDFLTAPIITLGLSLTVYLLLNIKNGNISWKDNFIKIIQIGLAWTLGYGLCWVSKWALSSMCTEKNVFNQAIYSIIHRSAGLEYDRASWFLSFRNNIGALVSQNIILICIWMAIVIALLVLSCIYRVDKKQYAIALLFICVFSFPYVWYFVLANHSQMHSWFTYRAQVVSIFSGLTTLTFAIDWLKVRNKAQKIQVKIKGLYAKFDKKK